MKESAHVSISFSHVRCRDQRRSGLKLDIRQFQALDFDPKTLGNGARNPVDNDLPIVFAGYCLALGTSVGRVFLGTQGMVEGSQPVFRGPGQRYDRLNSSTESIGAETTGRPLARYSCIFKG